MIHKINQGGNKFAHIRLDKVRSCVELRRQISKVGSNNLVEISFFISFVKSLQTICKQAESTTDKDPTGIHFFQLSGGINHASAGRDHIVYDNDIFTLDITSKEFVCDDRVLAVYNSGVVAALVEHTHVYTKYVREVHGT